MDRSPRKSSAVFAATSSTASTLQLTVCGSISWNRILNKKAANYLR